MKKYFLLLACTFILFSCGDEKKSIPSPLKEGIWRGILTLNDSTGLILPFKFDLSFKNDSTKMIIRNGEENILVDEITFVQDSVIIRMPLFDSEFRCKAIGDSVLTGNWINHLRTKQNVIPFTANSGVTNIYDCPEYDENFSFGGKWECVFGPTDPDSAKAIGIFKQDGHKASGTFLTETGDYRYLEGCLFGKRMLLYGFDGSYAYVFHAEVMEDGTIWGEFYSGIHLNRTWLAKRNESFQLRNADSLTALKSGFTKMDFVFPSIDNKKVSLSDEKYKNKVVVLQILGTWCSNCVDETMFLSDLDKKYKAQGLEVIGLAFEKTTDFEKAKKNISRLKKKYNAGYEFLISGFQPKDADKALPMINHVMSFPTTIFIDRKGSVRKIHTGYSGPATGEAHTQFKNETDLFIKTLLQE